MSPRWICVFCGARQGTARRYVPQVIDFGHVLVQQGMGLVYGGASIGLMGVIADTVLAAGGEVIGVIPEGLLEKEIAHSGLTRLIVTRSLSERKARMLELSDAFVALPGGTGTLDELTELWTAAQLGLHTKPIGLLNAGNYFDSLLKFLDHSVTEGFLSPGDRHLLHVEVTPQKLLERLTRAAAAD
jgi:uncharacterized protein (TIGR00730 family)